MVYCQILECTERCVTISEPDSPNTIATKYGNDGDTPELRRLARSVIRMECRPFQAFATPRRPT